jgi:hypothetical protein
MLILNNFMLFFCFCVVVVASPLCFIFQRIYLYCCMLYIVFYYCRRVYYCNYLLIVCYLIRVSVCMRARLFVFMCHFNICKNHYIDWNYIFMYVFWGKLLVAIGCWQSSLNKNCEDTKKQNYARRISLKIFL